MSFSGNGIDQGREKMEKKVKNKGESEDAKCNNKNKISKWRKM